MAKKNDQFEKFRQATLGSGTTLSDALSSGVTRKEEEAPAVKETVSPTPAAPAPEPEKPAGKVSKNANRRLISINVDKDHYRLLGLIKFDTGRQYNDLFAEALQDLLKKYGKL